MRRRTFVKALLYTLPALYWSPFPCQSLGAETVKEHKQEFVIFFIGGYGRQVLGEFNDLRGKYPILNPCRHITMDTRSEAGLIKVSDNSGLTEVLVKSLNCEVACFVLDSRNPESLALAEMIGGVLKRQTGAVLLCLSPVVSDSLKGDLFNFTVETLTKDQDFTSRSLLTLYNAYLGCGSMGCFQCLKFLFDSMELKKKHFRAKVGIAIQKGKIGQFDSAKLVRDAISQCHHPANTPASCWGILEMNPSEDKALQFYDEVFFLINESMGMQDNAVILHLGLAWEEAKLTIFGICPERG